MKKARTSETAPPAPSGGGPRENGPAAPAPQRRPRGRPLSFDRDAALEKAMLVFWERGYEGASISDLTAAMGITPPSLYTAFGDKETLYLEAMERYLLGPGNFAARALSQETTARESVRRLLRDAAAELTRECHPQGCMMALTAASCSVATEHIQAAMARRRSEALDLLRERIQRGIDDGELPPGTDAAALANYYATVYQGMSMQAKDGAGRDSLLASAEMAMRAWPASG